MNAEQIIKAAIPKADHRLCDYILWNRTPFPMGRVTARSLYRAASAFQRANNNGRTLCDCCDHQTQPGEWCCNKCRAALQQEAS